MKKRSSFAAPVAPVGRTLRTRRAARRFIAETAVLSVIAFAAIMIVGPTAPGTIAYRIAMSIYTGTVQP